MELLMLLLIAGAVIVAVYFIKKELSNGSRQQPTPLHTSQPRSPYTYKHKPYILTAREAGFYKRLLQVVDGKYFIFPQVHLSSLATNTTTGNYQKAGFQRSNRRSVDYVLADPSTLQAVYAVELDDSTHDTAKGRAVDAIKTDILAQAGIPLVRFRNIENIQDYEIIAKFQEAQAKIEERRELR